MIRTILLASALAMLPALAQAKAFKLGDDEAVAWITMPDTWEPREIDNGVEATSPDKETYVAAEIVAGNDLDKAGEEADKFFREQKITIKADSKVEKKTTVSGLPAYDINWDATDADGPTHVSLTLVKVADEKVLLLTYWGSAAGETSNKDDLAAIGKSIKPIK